MAARTCSSASSARSHSATSATRRSSQGITTMARPPVTKSLILGTTCDEAMPRRCSAPAQLMPAASNALGLLQSPPRTILKRSKDLPTLLSDLLLSSTSRDLHSRQLFSAMAPRQSICSVTSLIGPPKSKQGTHSDQSEPTHSSITVKG